MCSTHHVQLRSSCERVCARASVSAHTHRVLRKKWYLTALKRPGVKLSANLIESQLIGKDGEYAEVPMYFAVCVFLSQQQLLNLKVSKLTLDTHMPNLLVKTGAGNIMCRYALMCTLLHVAVRTRERRTSRACTNSRAHNITCRYALVSTHHHEDARSCPHNITCKHALVCTMHHVYSQAHTFVCANMKNS